MLKQPSDACRTPVQHKVHLCSSWCYLCDCHLRHLTVPYTWRVLNACLSLFHMVTDINKTDSSATLSTRPPPCSQAAIRDVRPTGNDLQQDRVTPSSEQWQQWTLKPLNMSCFCQVECNPVGASIQKCSGSSVRHDFSTMRILLGNFGFICNGNQYSIVSSWPQKHYRRFCIKQFKLWIFSKVELSTQVFKQLCTDIDAGYYLLPFHTNVRCYSREM